VHKVEVQRQGERNRERDRKKTEKADRCPEREIDLIAFRERLDSF
jgi:hypothetical protein